MKALVGEIFYKKTVYPVLDLGMVGRSIRKQELDGVYHEYG